MGTSDINNYYISETLCNKYSATTYNNVDGFKN